MRLGRSFARELEQTRGRGLQFRRRGERERLELGQGGGKLAAVEERRALGVDVPQQRVGRIARRPRGGEAAALVVIEAVSRLLPGVMGNEASATDESFTSGLLEYPHYTRPALFRGWEVPEVLRTGDHGRIESWRRAMALRRTIDQRPDLIAARGGLSEDEYRLLDTEDRAVPPDADAGPDGGGPGP